jgi:hypothetical protein
MDIWIWKEFFAVYSEGEFIPQSKERFGSFCLLEKLDF